MHISENPTFFQMWGDFRHWLAARQLFEEKRPLTPLAPCPAGHRPSGASVELGTEEPQRQWSLHRKPRPLTPQAAMGGDLGIALSMRGQDRSFHPLATDTQIFNLIFFKIEANHDLNLTTI